MLRSNFGACGTAMEVLAFFFYGTDVFLGVAQGEVDGDDVLGCPRFHHSNTRECYVCVFCV